MVWFPVAEYTGKGFEMMLTGEYDLYCKDRTAIQYADCIFYAFTVADLLAVLPKVMEDDDGVPFYLNIQYTRKEYSEIEYKGVYGILWRCFGASLLNNLVESVDGVVTNGYGLNL